MSYAVLQDMNDAFKTDRGQFSKFSSALGKKEDGSPSKDDDKKTKEKDSNDSKKEDDKKGSPVSDSQWYDSYSNWNSWYYVTYIRMVEFNIVIIYHCRVNQT